MDFHIDRKMGLMLITVFILGGVIGGLVGVTAGHEGREFRDLRGRGDLSMMRGGRFGNDAGLQDGAGSGRNFNRSGIPQGAGRTNAGITASPVQVAPASTTPLQ